MFRRWGKSNKSNDNDDDSSYDSDDDSSYDSDDDSSYDSDDEFLDISDLERMSNELAYDVYVSEELIERYESFLLENWPFISVEGILEVITDHFELNWDEIEEFDEKDGNELLFQVTEIFAKAIGQAYINVKPQIALNALDERVNDMIDKSKPPAYQRLIDSFVEIVPLGSVVTTSKNIILEKIEEYRKNRG